MVVVVKVTVKAIAPHEVYDVLVGEGQQCLHSGSALYALSPALITCTSKFGI